MSMLVHSVVDFLAAEDGATAVEYAVMLAMVIVVCIGAVTTLGNNANKSYNSTASAAKISSS